jgi:cardiolipin synthase (CMP-forming)
MRHLPNLICILRVLLIWPILAALTAADYPRALALFFVAAMSDGLDGFLAKRFQWTSDLGKFLDPAADTLLLLGVFLVLTWYGLIPPRLTTLAVARDVLIAGGALIYYFGYGPLHGRPMMSSKINTLVQLLYVIAVIAHAGYGLPSIRMLQVLAALMIVTIVISGYFYTMVFTQRALSAVRA